MHIFRTKQNFSYCSQGEDDGMEEDEDEEASEDDADDNESFADIDDLDGM